MAKSNSIFDIIGPIMIGPSSSHTAGACRIAKTARMLAGSNFKKIEFYLHGSFAETYKGHGTDKALLAGALGMNPDDERLRDSFKLADEQKLDYKFIKEDLGDVHSNTVKIIMYNNDDSFNSIVGSSIGGGSIEIIDINGMEINFTDEYPTLILKYYDTKGIIAFVSSIISEQGYNIESIKTTKVDNLVALIVEFDRDLEDYLYDEIKSDPRFIFTKNIKKYSYI